MIRLSIAFFLAPFLLLKAAEPTNSPEQVVTQYYDAKIAGKYEESLNFLTPEAQALEISELILSAGTFLTVGDGHQVKAIEDVFTKYKVDPSLIQRSKNKQDSGTLEELKKLFEGMPVRKRLYADLSKALLDTYCMFPGDPVKVEKVDTAGDRAKVYYIMINDMDKQPQSSLEMKRVRDVWLIESFK